MTCVFILITCRLRMAYN